jgi:leucyl aminopeptidase
VVTAGDGSTIEIGSTDAEGRLILADGIWYAREHLNARVIVDIATLTGAKVGALGTQYSALFTRDARLEETLRAAGGLTGERVWPLPLEGYEGITRSRIADQINTGSPGAQAGAIFLEHFAGDTPWAHLDIAGDAFVASAQGIHPEGSTGHGVRLLTEWVLAFEGVGR